MTLQEADKIAEQGLPVISGGVEYEAITMIGYKYIDGRKYPFVRLKDKSGNSFTDASPSMCTVASKGETE